MKTLSCPDSQGWGLQELYRAVPVLLSPVLGNPIALASFGVDPNASFPDKVCSTAHMPVNASGPSLHVGLPNGLVQWRSV